MLIALQIACSKYLFYHDKIHYKIKSVNENYKTYIYMMILCVHHIIFKTATLFYYKSANLYHAKWKMFPSTLLPFIISISKKIASSYLTKQPNSQDKTQGIQELSFHPLTNRVSTMKNQIVADFFTKPLSQGSYTKFKTMNLTIQDRD